MELAIAESVLPGRCSPRPASARSSWSSSFDLHAGFTHRTNGSPGLPPEQNNNEFAETAAAAVRSGRRSERMANILHKALVGT